MTELPIVVSDDVVTVGGYTNQVELQLSVGATGERGSRIFTGSVPPASLPIGSPEWGGYTDFKSGDIYLQRDTDVLEVWEWLYTSGEYTWVRTVEDIAGSGGSVTLDPDLNAIANLSGTGILRRTGVNAWALDTAAYLTSNQTITLSGDATGSGATAITVAVVDDSHSHTGATISALDASDTTTGTFNIARIPTGTTGTTVAFGNHTHSYVPTVSSTDNAVARFDGTGGALQTSGVTIDDSDNVVGVGNLTQERAYPTHVLNGVGGAGGILWQTSGSNRFDLGMDDSPGDLRIIRRNDSGGWEGEPLRINRATGKITLGDVGATAGLEFGASGPRAMVGTGGPSGIAAPVGSTWRQTDANSSHGSLTGLLWNKVGTGTTEGTDWLVDFEGRWVSYPPTIGGFSLGTGSTTEGKYTRRGKTATFKVLTKMGTSPTAAGSWTTTLPVTAAEAGERYSLTAFVLDSGSNYYDALALYNATTSVAVWGTGTSGIAIGLNTLGFTWAVNDVVSVNGTYEIA